MNQNPMPLLFNITEWACRLNLLIFKEITNINNTHLKKVIFILVVFSAFY